MGRQGLLWLESFTGSKAEHPDFLFIFPRCRAQAENEWMGLKSTHTSKYGVKFHIAVWLCAFCLVSAILVYMHAILCFPGGSAGKEAACIVGDLGLIPRLGRSPWRRE